MLLYIPLICPILIVAIENVTQLRNEHRLFFYSYRKRFFSFDMRLLQTGARLQHHNKHLLYISLFGRTT